MRFERIRTGEDPRYGGAMALYQRSFPIFEQRCLQAQLAVMPQEEYRFTLLYEGKDFAGLLLYWETDSFCYVEHLCILEAMRGKGCGSRALAFLREKGKKIILEIDPPADPVSQRRQRFYERAGYRANPYPHVHPPYRTEYAGHPLVVMSCPSVLEQQEYEAFDSYLRNTVMRRLGRTEKGEL